MIVRRNTTPGRKGCWVYCVAQRRRENSERAGSEGDGCKHLHEGEGSISIGLKHVERSGAR